MEFVAKHTVYDSFLDNNLSAIDWDFVSKWAQLSDKQILKYARFLNMLNVSKYQKVSLHVAKRLVNVLDMDTLSAYQEHLSIADIFKLKVLASIE